MNKIAKFEKVSYEQFRKDWMKNNPDISDSYSESDIREMYDSIKIPQRGTKGSAGYDIIAPYPINIKPGTASVIPTGLRCKIQDGWFLDLNPRSGHGFKSGIHLANTRGIIDSDYYNADNEGHIMVKLVNDCNAITEDTFSVEKGKGFCQGIFTVYGITEDDMCEMERTGGFGSTDKN